jgi:propanediol dehydratase small subunit
MAAALRTTPRARVAFTMRELEAAVETARRFDKENLALVFERSLQVLEMPSDLALRNPDNGRQVTSGDGPIE